VVVGQITSCKAVRHLEELFGEAVLQRVESIITIWSGTCTIRERRTRAVTELLRCRVWSTKVERLPGDESARAARRPMLTRCHRWRTPTTADLEQSWHRHLVPRPPNLDVNRWHMLSSRTGPAEARQPGQRQSGLSRTDTSPSGEGFPLLPTSVS
jgi:hypothetical protein